MADNTRAELLPIRLADVKAIAASALQTACESDPADPEHPDTICITTGDFETIVRCAIENWIDLHRIAATRPSVGAEGLVERLRAEYSRNGGQGAYAWCARELCGKAADEIERLSALRAQPVQEPVALTNGQCEADDMGEIGDAARRIASYCEGAVRMNVYKKAKQELVALTRPTPSVSAEGLVERRDVLTDVAAHLAAAISLLERGGKAVKKAAPSDRMFDQMLTDYKASLERARAALRASPPQEPVAWMYGRDGFEPVAYRHRKNRDVMAFLQQQGWTETPLYASPHDTGAERMTQEPDLSTIAYLSGHHDGRKKALEEAARVAAATKSYDDALQQSAGCATVGNRIAAAIRNLAKTEEG